MWFDEPAAHPLGRTEVERLERGQRGVVDARLDPAPQSFERILEWLLDGIEGTLVTAPE